MSEREQYTEEVKEFFKKLRKCDIHPDCECTYLGTIEERLAKLQSLKDETKQETRYVDACRPETSENPYAYML